MLVLDLVCSCKHPADSHFFLWYYYIHLNNHLNNEALKISKSKNNTKYLHNSPEKRRSKSYVLVHGISGALCLIAAIAILIAMITEHISWGLIFLILLAFLLGLFEIASVRAVHKHGAKVMPRQVIYPIVKLWKDNGVDPAEMKNPLQRPPKRH
jgi:hypothetical protein